MSDLKPDPIELDQRLRAETDRLIPETEDAIRKTQQNIDENAEHLKRLPRRSYMSPTLDGASPQS